eukprot:13448027-Ditylum_brightwellii.AAC.1
MAVFPECGQTSKTSTSETSNFTLDSQIEHPGQNNKNDQGIKEHQHKILLAKVEALYMLKDRHLARDKNLMLLSLLEISQFVDNHNTQYLDQQLHIWQPIFRQGVITETRRAVENLSLITSYSHHKTSTARVLLPHGYQSLHDKLDNNCPVGNI